jgi:hypothetical protein
MASLRLLGLPEDSDSKAVAGVLALACSESTRAEALAGVLLSPPADIDSHAPFVAPSAAEIEPFDPEAECTRFVTLLLAASAAAAYAYPAWAAVFAPVGRCGAAAYRSRVVAAAETCHAGFGDVMADTIDRLIAAPTIRACLDALCSPSSRDVLLEVAAAGLRGVMDEAAERSTLCRGLLEAAAPSAPSATPTASAAVLARADSAKTDLASAEMGRQAATRRCLPAMRRALLLPLTETLSALMNGRGAWCSGEEAADGDSIFWRLDDSATPGQHLRRHLVRFPRGSDHAEAARRTAREPASPTSPTAFESDELSARQDAIRILKALRTARVDVNAGVFGAAAVDDTEDLGDADDLAIPAPPPAQPGGWAIWRPNLSALSDRTTRGSLCPAFVVDAGLVVRALPPSDPMLASHRVLSEAGSTVDDVSSRSQAFRARAAALSERQLLQLSGCNLVAPLDLTPGRLVLTSRAVVFVASSEEAEDAGSVSAVGHSLTAPTSAAPGEFTARWELADLLDLQPRRHLLRHVAVEFSLRSGTQVLLATASHRDAALFVSRVVALRPPRLVSLPIWRPADRMKKSGLTQLWQRGLISNLDYLMALNVAAGRSFRDLSQYPVMPWIIADWTSKKLDLSNPDTFRDLSRPMGALNPSKAAELRERFAMFSLPDSDIPPFHHGTHYSSLGVVLYYLRNVEPFTSLLVQLQSGQFDHADRMFFSLPRTYTVASSGGADCKELVPELFTLPEALTNHNGIVFCVRQNGDRLNDVELPPWARDADDFIRQHRAALESDFVSANLHKWIDLVFGYRQRGAAAVEALNTFYHLTYEGAVDLDAIDDPIMRKSIIAQIDNFGQTPSQLFARPHPARAVSPTLRVPRIDWSSLPLSPSLAAQPAVGVPAVVADCPLSNTPRLVVIGRDGHVSVLEWVAQDHAATPGVEGAVPAIRPVLGVPHLLSSRQTGTKGSHVLARRLLEVEAGPGAPLLPVAAREPLTLRRLFSAASPPNWARRVGLGDSVGHSRPHRPSELYAVSPSGNTVYSGGHWDQSLRVTDLSNISLGSVSNTQVLTRHRGIVTCVSLSEDGGDLASGSEDTTVVVWELSKETGNVVDARAGQGFTVSHTQAITPPLRPRHVLAAHDAAVTCAAVSSLHDAVVSGSSDGTVVVHTLASGAYVRTLELPPTGPGAPRPVPTHISIVFEGNIVVYCENDLSLRLFSPSGRPLTSIDMFERIVAPAVTPDRKTILCMSERGLLVARSASDLTRIPGLPVGWVRPGADARPAAKAVCMSLAGQALIQACPSGELLAFPVAEVAPTHVA